MDIKDVKTAFKIADVEYIKDQTKLKFKYLNPIFDEQGKELSQKILTQNVARVYLIVVNGIIVKIGGSQSNGGIKNTLQIYQDGGVNGRPSIRSYGVWYYLYSTILKKQKIEFYMIYQENFDKEIKGLFGVKNKKAYISYKLIEQSCIEDFRERENGKFPEWNLQEQGQDWDDEIKQNHAILMQESTKRQGRNKG